MNVSYAMYTIFKSELIMFNSILMNSVPRKLWQPFTFRSVIDYRSVIDSTLQNEMNGDALEKPGEYSPGG